MLMSAYISNCDQSYMFILQALDCTLNQNFKKKKIPNEHLSDLCFRLTYTHGHSLRNKQTYLKNQL